MASRAHVPRAVDRREFIVGSAALALLSGCPESDGAPGDGGPDRPPVADGPAPVVEGPPPGTSRVVEVNDPGAVKGKTLDGTRVKTMLLKGLTTLAGTPDIRQAWRLLIPDFSATMRIGLKVNCLSSYLYNSVEVLSALVESLVKDLGADAQRIMVWDRRGDELSRSKITQQAVGARVLGTVASESDPTGPGYETQALAVAGKQTHLSRVLTQQTDVTINLPVLKTHTISGITGALKNLYGAIDNPGDFHDGLDGYLPALYALPPIPKHVRLSITEGLLAVVKGDTTDPPDTIAARMLFSTDPVAMDARSVDLINKLRGTLPPVSTAKLKWLENAETSKLGTRKVELKQVQMT